jgi:outer membrane protein OmpA-like peptidoglycan-associated protein
MSRARGWVWLIPIGLVATALLSVGATWQQGSEIQSKLTDASQTALVQAGLSDGNVTFHGRDATLSDFSPDELARATSVVRGVDGVRDVNTESAAIPAPAGNNGPASTPGAAAPTTASTVTSGMDNGTSTTSVPSVSPSDSKEALQLALNQQLSQTPITFRANSADLTAPGKQAVRQIAKVMSEASQTVRFEIGGYVAKTTGTEQGALSLSKQRAQAVVKSLISSGVEGKRLVAKGYGDTQPNPNGDDRRVEISVR